LCQAEGASIYISFEFPAEVAIAEAAEVEFLGKVAFAVAFPEAADLVQSAFGAHSGLLYQ
jgi:hypothetical protein